MDSLTYVAKTIQQVLDELGTRFGSTGAHLWQELVAYEQTEAKIELLIIFTIMSLTVLVGVPLAIYALRLPLNKYDNLSDKAGALGVVAVVCGVVFLLTGFVLALGGPSIIATLYHPEASVLNDLLIKLN